MDPVLGSVIVALIASVGALGTAIVNARSSAAMLQKDDLIRRQERLITELGGDPDDA